MTTRSRFPVGDIKKLLIALLMCCVQESCAGAQKATPAPKPLRAVSIRFAWGAGLCDCYCGAEMQVTPAGVKLLRRPFGECQQRDPEKYREFRVDADLSAKHWQELEQLIDHDALFALPDTIGCASCVDRVDEFIEVTFSNRTKKSVRYPAGSAPKEIRTLSEKLTAMETKLEVELPNLPLK